jgi:hypothetical protein
LPNWAKEKAQQNKEPKPEAKSDNVARKNPPVKSTQPSQPKKESTTTSTKPKVQTTQAPPNNKTTNKPVAKATDKKETPDPKAQTTETDDKNAEGNPHDEIPADIKPKYNIHV